MVFATLMLMLAAEMMSFVGDPAFAFAVLFTAAFVAARRSGIRTAQHGRRVGVCNLPKRRRRSVSPIYHAP